MAKVELSDAALEARRKYIREWKRNNPDKVKTYHVNYWERKAKEAANEQRHQ